MSLPAGNLPACPAAHISRECLLHVSRSLVPEEAAHIREGPCKLKPCVFCDSSAADDVKCVQRQAVVLLQSIDAGIGDASDAMQGQQLQFWAPRCQCYHCCIRELNTPGQVQVLQAAPLCQCCNCRICICASSLRMWALGHRRRLKAFDTLLACSHAASQSRCNQLRCSHCSVVPTNARPCQVKDGQKHTCCLVGSTDVQQAQVLQG